MRSFLHEVAADLYGRYGDDLSSLSVMFPSRRARLFFVDALTRVAERPLWQPRWTTVDELMGEISGLQCVERVRLITELYRVYSEFHDEPFDKFYFWGELLLSDFDTIDKYLIDAGMLLRNLADIKEIETDVSYLTPEQLRIVSFWATFGDRKDLSLEKRRFLAVWETLGPIYRRFRERLAQLGIAYTGMMHRAAVERIEAGDFAFPEPRRFAVAGFNALSACEKRLFRFLFTAAQTDFYWDYDDYYVRSSEQEAGMFVRDNLRMFPPRASVAHDGMSRPKRIESVAAVSDAVQCKHVASILRGIAAGGELDKRTAIVLTDENLLLPLLYALPPETGRVNVTMGFPLKQSLAYTFVERLLELQSGRRRRNGEWVFYHAHTEGMLAHPYVVGEDPDRIGALLTEIRRERRITIAASVLAATPLLERIFRAEEDWRALSDYRLDVVGGGAATAYGGEDARERTEFLAVVAEQITRLRNSLDACGIDLTVPIYASLLRRHFQTLRIPFEGEPLEGLQVMGILETRNLDFENVIVLSMDDDNFPGSHTVQSSFIPYGLCAAYGLPTPEHHEGVYAYYFYRLIQRASNVWMLYCSQADEKSTGEPSRYIRQLDYESHFEVRKTEVGVDVNLPADEPLEVEKCGEAASRLARFLDAEHPVPLSPTAFFRYVACPLRFYFYSVAGLAVRDEVADEVDAPMFGTILHGAMQRLYAPLVGALHPGEALWALARSGEAERAVVAAVNEHYLRDAAATPADYTGNLLLVKSIVTRYIRDGILPYDAARDGFTVRGVERRVECLFPFDPSDPSRRVLFAGTADRIDALDDGTLRVVDYKTGAPAADFDGVEALFGPEARRQKPHILQTLLYAMMLRRAEGCDVEPALYYVRAMHRPGYVAQLTDKSLKVTGARYDFYSEAFEGELRTKLAELFDLAVPFRQCGDREICRFCDYRAICRR